MMIEKKGEKRMNVKDFVEASLKITNKEQKLEWIKSIANIKKYIPYSQKLMHASAIVDYSCIDNGQILFDSCKGYMLEIFSLIYLYTDLEVDKKNFNSDYDILLENGVLNIILELIPESERTEFSMIVTMRRQDFIDNNYEGHAFLSKQVDKISKILEEVSLVGLEKLSNKIDTADKTKLYSFIKEFKNELIQKTNKK